MLKKIGKFCFQLASKKTKFFTSAIILAAGKSERMKEVGIPKQMIELNGIPVVVHSLLAFEKSESGDILVYKAPACTIETQARAVCELFSYDPNNIKIIGARHGEKNYETLLTIEESSHAIDMGDFYRIPSDKRGLNYDSAFSEGKLPLAREFNSNNTSYRG